MSYYPLFLDLRGRHVLVVGAGQVGRRKVAGLAEAAPELIMVVDPAFEEGGMQRLRDMGPVQCLCRCFVPDDIQGKTLVFAATNSKKVNALVTRLCRESGILCNNADAPNDGSFIVPAHFTTGGITVALSTAGQSPALARVLRADLEAFVGSRYTRILPVLGRLRPLLLTLDRPSSENAALLRALVHSPLAGQLEFGDYASASATLVDLLPEPLRGRVGELLYGH